MLICSGGIIEEKSKEKEKQEATIEENEKKLIFIIQINAIKQNFTMLKKNVDNEKIRISIYIF